MRPALGDDLVARQDFDHQNAQPFSLKGGEDGVLLIHGFTGSPSHMRPLGEYLHARGFTVRGILLPGHNGKVEDMFAANHRQWLNTSLEAAREMRAKHRRFYAAGLSMGGVLSLIIAEEGLCDAVTTFAAPMRIYNWTAPLAPLVWPFMPYSPWKKLKTHNELDPAYDFGYDATPVRRVSDLSRLMRKAELGLARVTCPLLTVQSRLDETVKPESVSIIANGVSSERKSALWLERSAHVLTIGPETDIVFPAVANFFAEAGA